MGKVVVIHNCNDCPFHFFDADEPHKWGKHWCDKLDREISVESEKEIDPDCPLEDAQ